MLLSCTGTQRLTSLIVALLLTHAASAISGAPHSDIFLTITDSQLQTGTVERSAFVEQRVFPAMFGDAGSPTFTSNPGYFGFNNPFTPGTRIGIVAVDGFKFWNGAGFESTGGEQLEISFLFVSFIVGDVPTEDSIDLQVQPDGGFHQHFTFQLIGDALDPGVYLLNLEVYSTAGGIANSDPYWIVFDYQARAGEFDAAFAWAEMNLPNETACASDVNGDQSVDVFDVLDVLSNWGACPMPCPPTCDKDTNSDCNVDVFDVLNILSDWGACAS